MNKMETRKEKEKELEEEKLKNNKYDFFAKVN